MLRGALLRVSRSHKIKDLVTTAPVTASVVERFIAGETSDGVVAVTRRLVGRGCWPRSTTWEKTPPSRPRPTPWWSPISTCSPSSGKRV